MPSPMESSQFGARTPSNPMMPTTPNMSVPPPPMSGLYPGAPPMVSAPPMSTPTSAGVGNEQSVNSIETQRKPYKKNMTAAELYGSTSTFGSLDQSPLNMSQTPSMSGPMPSSSSLGAVSPANEVANEENLYKPAPVYDESVSLYPLMRLKGSRSSLQRRTNPFKSP